MVKIFEVKPVIVQINRLFHDFSRQWHQPFHELFVRFRRWVQPVEGHKFGVRQALLGNVRDVNEPDVIRLAVLFGETVVERQLCGNRRAIASELAVWRIGVVRDRYYDDSRFVSAGARNRLIDQLREFCLIQAERLLLVLVVYPNEQRHQIIIGRKNLVVDFVDEIGRGPARGGDYFQIDARLRNRLLQAVLELAGEIFLEGHALANGITVSERKIFEHLGRRRGIVLLATGNSADQQQQ